MSEKPNAGGWTDEERERFVRSPEADRHGNENAVGVTFAPTSSPTRIQAHALQHISEGAGAGLQSLQEGNEGGRHAFSINRNGTSAARFVSLSGVLSINHAVLQHQQHQQHLQDRQHRQLPASRIWRGAQETVGDLAPLRNIDTRDLLLYLALDDGLGIL